MLESSGAMSLGTRLPNFNLPDTVSAKMVASAAFSGEPLVVAFLCNHCPYVKHLRAEFADFARWCDAHSVRVVAISSNDPITHPQDGPEAMAQEAASVGYGFPYLFDESQEIATAFGAVCTPEFFLFDAEAKLTYHGEFDASRPSSGVAVTGEALRQAVELVLTRQPPMQEQRPSVGCSIKWSTRKAPR